jgi:hypothetical protein
MLRVLPTVFKRCRAQLRELRPWKEYGHLNCLKFEVNEVSYLSVRPVRTELEFLITKRFKLSESSGHSFLSTRLAFWLRLENRPAGDPFSNKHYGARGRRMIRCTWVSTYSFLVAVEKVCWSKLLNFRGLAVKTGGIVQVRQLEFKVLYFDKTLRTSQLHIYTR